MPPSDSIASGLDNSRTTETFPNPRKYALAPSHKSGILLPARQTPLQLALRSDLWAHPGPANYWVKQSYVGCDSTLHANALIIKTLINPFATGFFRTETSISLLFRPECAGFSRPTPHGSKPNTVSRCSEPMK